MRWRSAVGTSTKMSTTHGDKGSSRPQTLVEGKHLCPLLPLSSPAWLSALISDEKAQPQPGASRAVWGPGPCSVKPLAAPKALPVGADS